MASPTLEVNNDIYHDLGQRWYTAQDDPVALLRAESRVRNPWVIATIQELMPNQRLKVLDIGCGAGFLSNALAAAGFEVTGLDASISSLAVAANYDQSKSVHYLEGDANALPFSEQNFDVVCAMDFLEHVDDPAHVIAEAARVLKSDGLFFFHTFNRNLFSRLVAIKGVEIFVKNTPKNLHVYKYFIKPDELTSYCETANLSVQVMHGLRPRIATKAFWKMIATGTVDDSFAFEFCRSTIQGYTGFARKL